jgi:hypothetical protein
LNNINNNFSLLQKDVKNVRYYHNLQNSCSPIATVGLKETKKSSNKLWIYPNPTEGNLNINLDHNADKASIKVYDLTGKVIYAGILNNAYRMNIDLCDFAAGVYFLEVKEGEFKSVEKIIKQ